MTLTDDALVAAGNAALRLMEPPAATIPVFDGVTNDTTGTTKHRAVAFPRYHGPDHPADDGRDRRELWLRRPRTGVEFRAVAV